MDKRHFFAGANTYKGFTNLFDNIGGRFTIILKGTPGCGKSTLLRAVAKHFSDMGEDIEYFNCSADPDSLDGIRLIGRDVSIVDGTAPHVVEPKVGRDDRILNLAPNLVLGIEAAVKIAKLERKKQKAFKRAADWHRKAYDAHKVIEGIYRPFLDFDKVSQITQGLISEIEKIDAQPLDGKRVT